jgi:hypothetical protein
MTFFEIPSMQEVEEMERQRSQAIEALEVSNHSVKRQSCSTAVPIVGKLPVRNDRIVVLQRRIKWREEHHSCYVRRFRRGMATAARAKAMMMF